MRERERRRYPPPAERPTVEVLPPEPRPAHRPHAVSTRRASQLRDQLTGDGGKQPLEILFRRMRYAEEMALLLDDELRAKLLELRRDADRLNVHQVREINALLRALTRWHDRAVQNADAAAQYTQPKLSAISVESEGGTGKGVMVLVLRNGLDKL